MWESHYLLTQEFIRQERMYVFFSLMFTIRCHQTLYGEQNDLSLALQKTILHVSALIPFVFHRPFLPAAFPFSILVSLSSNQLGLLFNFLFFFLISRK